MAQRDLSADRTRSPSLATGSLAPPALAPDGAARRFSQPQHPRNPSAQILGAGWTPPPYAQLVALCQQLHSQNEKLIAAYEESKAENQRARQELDRSRVQHHAVLQELEAARAENQAVRTEQSEREPLPARATVSLSLRRGGPGGMHIDVRVCAQPPDDEPEAVPACSHRGDSSTSLPVTPVADEPASLPASSSSLPLALWRFRDFRVATAC